MKLNWNFVLGGGETGSAKQKPSVGGIWILSETAHCKLVAWCVLIQSCIFRYSYNRPEKIFFHRLICSQNLDI